MTLSLRTQLSLWFGLAVLIIVFVMTFMIQEVTIWSIEKAIDDALQKRVNMVAAIVSSDITTDEESYVLVMSELAKQELPFVPLLLRLISPSGKVIIEFGHVAATIVQDLDYQLQFPDVSEGRFDTMKSIETSPLRTYTISVTHPRTHETLAFVQGAESLAPVDEAKRQLQQSIMLIGLGGSLFAIVVGFVMIWLGFRPLKAILNTIDKVDYSNLQARLQEENRPAELQQLAKSLAAMWQRLERSVSQRRESISDISHDIRTPLTVLQGQLEVLLLQPSVTAQVKQGLERMLNETKRLVRLMKNLLLNFDLESAPALLTEHIDLGELLDEVGGDMWALAKELQFNIVSLGDVRVYGDRDLLKQMILNIVDNAIKFTPKGGKVDLMLTSEDNWAVIEVSDTGQGIPEKDLPYVTEAFYKPRASYPKAAGKGTGLGLSIVKRIIALHGGQLEIHSQEKVGTSVKVRLPRRLTIVLSERK